MTSPDEIQSAPGRLAPIDPLRSKARVAAKLIAREQKAGVAWNVTRTIAHAPAVLDMVDAAWTALAKSSLTHADRELVAIELAITNGCGYCVPAHRHVVLHDSEISPEERVQLLQVSSGETLPGHTRLGLMQQLVGRLHSARGDLPDDEFAFFVSNGIGAPQMIEVIAEIALATVMNFTNRLARTPLDPFLEPHR